MGMRAHALSYHICMCDTSTVTWSHTQSQFERTVKRILQTRKYVLTCTCKCDLHRLVYLAPSWQCTCVYACIYCVCIWLNQERTVYHIWRNKNIKRVIGTIAHTISYKNSHTCKRRQKYIWLKQLLCSLIHTHTYTTTHAHTYRMIPDTEYTKILRISNYDRRQSLRVSSITPGLIKHDTSQVLEPAHVLQRDLARDMKTMRFIRFSLFDLCHTWMLGGVCALCARKDMCGSERFAK